jgi:CRISPR-associated endoribonuclease Cas6
MRFRIDVDAAASGMAWADVHGAARGVVYQLLKSADPGLAADLHQSGWQGSGLRPVGASRPVFAGTASSRGRYATAGQGSTWLGSPVPVIAAALLRGAAGCGELRWGGTRLVVRGVAVEGTPDHAGGRAEFRAVTPVLVKRDSRYLLPGDEGYLGALEHNLRHKADLLGLPSCLSVELLEAGPRRRFQVRGGPRIGSQARLAVSADPAVLDALYCWGAGLDNIQGFGWLR